MNMYVTLYFCIVSLQKLYATGMYKTVNTLNIQNMNTYT